MDSHTESSLISKLQSSDLQDIHQLFSSYLHPFTDLTAPKPKKTKKPSKAADEDHRSTVRSLAKRFLPFLNRALSLLPKRLSETPRLDERFGVQLFDTYRLCLNCLDRLSSQLSCKPYSVHVQRVRLMHCFEAWGRYGDAENEGYSVLEGLRSVEIGISGLKKVKMKEQFLPDFRGGSVDLEFASLVAEIVVSVIKCTWMNRTKEEEDYRRVLALVEEVAPWFRVFDLNAYEKLHRLLVTYLGKCTLLLVEDLACFNFDLVHKFCLAVFAEYAKSSMKDQVQKFACRLCSSAVSQHDKELSSVVDLFICVLDSMAGECKVGAEDTVVEYLELVSYCANKCRTATENFRKAIAAHLNKIAGDFFQDFSPVDLILRLYATGLFISDWNGPSREGSFTAFNNMNDGSGSGFLHVNEDRLQHLSDLLSLLRCQFHKSSKENNLLSLKNSEYQIHSPLESNDDASVFCTQQNGKHYFLPYYNALKFLCHPLAELVNSGRKELLGEIEDASFSTKLCDIHNALHQFCDVFLFCHRAFKSVRDACDDNSKTILSVAAAAFTLSVRTGLNVKDTVNFIKHVISFDWIQSHGLKYLFASLHNVGIILYRNKQMNEASKALKLSCKASWTRVLQLCETFVDNSNRFNGDLSEDSIINFVTESCGESALLLDVLSQCGSHKVNKIIRDCLENWSVAEKSVKGLPSPTVLVKQWVKIECKLYKGVDDGATNLYSLLSSSAKVSKRKLGMISEQELLAYEQMNALNPRLSHQMKLGIMGILLEEVYVTNDSRLNKSRVLIAKAKELRAGGIKGLKSCIDCLSEAISTMSGLCFDETNSRNVPVRHQLAVAYCLRALSTHEAEPNSKLLFQDVHAALNLWLSPDHCLSDDQCDMVSENILVLLYHVVDLLSVKGYTKFHDDIYELIIRLFKLKNVALEKCVAMLWEYRRLGHALCASSVNEAFISTLSRHCGELSKSIDFWISCMKGLWPLQMGFQQNFSFIFTFLSQGSYRHNSSFRPDITIDEVKQAAVGLISTVPLPSGSVFVAAYLYYDLCERLISNGRLIEALFYAKEAQRLRSKLLKEKFMYSVKQQNKNCDGNGGTVQQHRCSLNTFRSHSSVATAFWSTDYRSCDLEGCLLTPWNVLQCYLESTLQVGIIHEIIGNVSEAEALLMWGKDISCSEGLQPFIIAYSSVLGQLYRKQRLWDLANKELESAKKVLADGYSDISCLKCRLVLEVIIDQQIGDLSRSYFDNCNSSLAKLSDAENLYRSALDKLNLSEWKNSVSYLEETSPKRVVVSDAFTKQVEHRASSSFANGTNYSDIRGLTSVGEGLVANIEAKKSRKTKKASKPLPQGQHLITEHNLRMTRSRYRSSQISSGNISSEVQIGLTRSLASEDTFDCHDVLEQRESLSEIRHCVADCGCEIMCACNKTKCWYCLPYEVIKSGSVINLIHMKWEFVRRKLSLRLLTSIGKCLGVQHEMHGAHEIFLQSMSMLVGRSSFCPLHPSVSFNFLLDLLEKDIPGDALAIEHAAVLYRVSWFILKSYPSRHTRINCCDLSSIQLPRIVSWLKLAFILCREVPILFRKVSCLLAALYILSATHETFSLSSSPRKGLSDGYWASYFHQASVGTQLNHQLFSSIIGRQKAQCPMDIEGSNLTGSCIGLATLNSLRAAPESLQELEEFVLKFFQGLPCTAIICISLLGGAYASLLGELLFHPHSVHAWIFISRMNSDSQPVVLLLPVASILEEAENDDDSDDENSCTVSPFEDEHVVKQWHCPWGSTVVDDIVPEFRFILKENYLSSSSCFLEDTKKNRSLWWMRRKRLDERLGKFLMDLEESWLGPWKYLLLGEWSASKSLDRVQEKLVHDLKYKCKVDVQESLLRIILGGAKYFCEREECALQLILNKGCYIAGVGYHDQESTGASSGSCDSVQSLSHMIFKLVFEAAREIEEAECAIREPLILVLDLEVQMLPWENLPVLRNQEVYRMPSVGSISATLDRCLRHQEPIGRNAVVFPLIDPLDAFYLLNPSGDLNSTQIEFESWFKDQNLQGKAGTAPTIEELTVALKSHDLFIYFGHGSGTQYIPGYEIQKLENCAATLLMGCSSGSLSLNGCYTPQGAPLCYLLAGSPDIIANLWEVTDKDIDRFAKAMLDSWVKERSTTFMGCVQCDLVAKEFMSMNISGPKRNAKKNSRKKLPETCDIITSNDCCNHRPKIGSFMSQARKACTLPFLTGASPVCYGVPSGIWNKKDL